MLTQPTSPHVDDEPPAKGFTESYRRLSLVLPYVRLQMTTSSTSAFWLSPGTQDGRQNKNPICQSQNVTPLHPVLAEYDIVVRDDTAEGVWAEAGPQKRAGDSTSFVKGTGEDQIFSKK